MVSDGGREGNVGGDIRCVQTKVQAMEGGMDGRIAKFINRQAASIGERLAFVIHGELHVR